VIAAQAAPEFSTFFRATVTLEGTLTTLCPGYLVIDAAQAIAAEWARDRLTPGTLQELARQELMALAPVLRGCPATSTGSRRSSSGATCGRT
jgi:ubiquinone biosynthesis protein